MRGRNGRRETSRTRPARARQIRRMLPVVFLLLSLGVAGAGAWEAYTAQRSHAATARAVLTDYGEFAAWSYQQRIHELLKTGLDQNFAAVRQNGAFLTGAATERCLDLLLADGSTGQCRCQPSLAGDFAFYVRLDGKTEKTRWTGEPPPESRRRGLVRDVAAHARTVFQTPWSYAVLETEDGELVAYVRLTTSPELGRDLRPSVDTLVYGVELSRSRLAELMRKALGDEILLPPTLTRGKPNHEVIQVEVVSHGGTVLFSSRPGQAHEYPAEDRLQEVVGGGTVRASVLPDVADQLIIGGLPDSQAPTLLLIFALAGALAVAAIVQLRRERRLALLRQDFVASVSHELRTPLAQVRLFTETLRLGRTRGDGERDWALENIDRETLRLSHLVEKILHFSRAERGVRPEDREPVELGSEIREILETFRPLVPATKARLVCDLPDNLAAEVHRDSLHQVLLNYLDNAVRYGPAGQTVRVAGSAEGSVVRVAVEDEGPGVPLAERERIFEPFRRSQEAMGTVASGSGIGLAVVREIADAHKGRAWVEDAPGGGARFVLELPALHTARRQHFVGDGPGRAPRENPAGAMEADSEVA